MRTIFFSLLALCLVLLVFVVRTGEKTPEEIEAAKCRDKSEAYEMATLIIREKRQFPDDAEFRSYFNPGVFVAIYERCKFTIAGSVKWRPRPGLEQEQRWVMMLNYIGNGQYKPDMTVFE